MKFAKVVFWIAGVWGVLVIAPLFFLIDTVSRQAPPAITHPEFYYGFADVTLMWQIAFFVIALDPERYRAMMIPPAVAKFGWAILVTTLYLQGRISSGQLMFGASDFTLAVLFVAAFIKTRPQVEDGYLLRE
jgi:hypothetical protein